MNCQALGLASQDLALPDLCRSGDQCPGISVGCEAGRDEGRDCGEIVGTWIKEGEGVR